MDYRSLHGKTVAELRTLAKLNQVKLPAGSTKSAIIDLLLQADQKQKEEHMLHQAAEQPKQADQDAVQSEQPVAEPETAAKPKPIGRSRSTAKHRSVAKPEPVAQTESAAQPEPVAQTE
ncbi:MAG TPA: hypothetical protein IAA59_05230, partial [Candidatus Faecaligallichristensenella faecipullorum]|nr:hypothetical protein [Candidatus Faecaligallichristensenella faecipullorum]